MGYVWHTSPVQSLEQARTRQLVLGGTSLGGNGIDMAIVARDVFGYRIKIVSGYKTSAETKIALERGEIDGTFANLWTSLKQTDWLARGLVRVIVQHGTQKHPEVPADVPLFRELAKTEAERQMIEISDIREEIARPYLAPPGLPAERLDQLRHAFDATMSDPEFPARTCRRSIWNSTALQGRGATSPWWRSGPRRRRLPSSIGSRPCSATIGRRAERCVVRGRPKGERPCARRSRLASATAYAQCIPSRSSKDEGFLKIRDIFRQADVGFAELRIQRSQLSRGSVRAAPRRRRRQLDAPGAAR